MYYKLEIDDLEALEFFKYPDSILNLKYDWWSNTDYKVVTIFPSLKELRRICVEIPPNSYLKSRRKIKIIPVQKLPERSVLWTTESSQ